MYLTRLREGTNPMTSKSSSPSTIESIKGTLRHIEYLRLDSTKTSEVDLDWHGHFIAQSECGGRAGRPLSLNYIGKHIKNVKTVLRYAHQREWHVHRHSNRGSLGFLKSAMKTSTSIAMRLTCSLKSLQKHLPF